MRNAAINRRKKLRRESAADIDRLELPSEEDIVLDFETAADAFALQELVAAMDEPDREIFVRKYYLMEPVKEIARRTELDEVQIRNRLYRGRQRLKKQLEERDITEYLGALETRTGAASKKEIAATTADALKKAGLKRGLSGRRKAGRILLVAAAVAACAAVTTAAAGVNIGDMFRGCFTVFNPISNHSETAGLTQGQIEMLNQTGAAVNQSVTSNGTTITITATAGDKHNAFFLMEVDAPKGKTLTDRNFSDVAFGDSTISLPEMESGGQNEGWTDSGGAVPEKCSPTKLVFLWDFHTVKTDLQGQEVRLAIKDLHDCNGRVIAKGSWAFDFKINYGDSETKTVKVDKTIHYLSTHKSNQNTTVQCTAGAVKLSALSASVDFTGDNLYDEDQIQQVPNWLIVHMRNGKNLFLHHNNGTGNSKKLTVSYPADEPIDLDNVVSVTIADATVPVP